MKPEQPDNHDRRGWHIHKGITVGELAMIATLIIGGASAYYGATARISVIENGLQAQSTRIDSVETRVTRSEERMDARLIRIEAKTDRILEQLARE